MKLCVYTPHQGAGIAIQVGVSGWVYIGRDREIGAYTAQELGIGP